MSGNVLPPQPPALQEPPVFAPKRIQVFGILHIVFASLGLFLTVFSLAGSEIEKSMSGSPPNPGSEAEKVAQAIERAMQSETAYMWISSGFGIAVAALCLMAGIALVRKKRNALMLSNTYVWVSLLSKGALIVFYLTSVHTGLMGQLDGIETTTDEAEMVLKFSKMVLALAFVGAPVLGAIYPLITLNMLNKPIARNFLVQHGQ